MINIASSRQDKFGYYQVGDLKTYRKFEAVEAQVKTNQPLQWNFNQEIYSSYNWAVEPTESLSELYRERAQQLRDQYDYLVLWFSGGADSKNILDAFVKNNIKLDEVASYVNYDATGDKSNFLNAEIYHLVPGMIVQAKETQPWLKHTVIDLTKITMDFFNESSSKFDWIYDVNSFVNPNTAARRDIKLKVPHWTDMFNSGKRVGFIYGTDKPRINGINGKYYFKFVDMIDNTINVNSQSANNAWEFNELFYWSPDCPRIVIKQGHVVKHYLKTATAMSEFLVNHHLPVSTVSTTIDNKLYWLTTTGLHTLIYPHWTPVPYQYKPPSVLFSPRDQWLFDLSDSDSAKSAWRIGLEQRWKATPDSMKRDIADISKGFKNLLSIPYCLGS
jgi:hypothetical protein